MIIRNRKRVPPTLLLTPPNRRRITTAKVSIGQGKLKEALDHLLALEEIPTELENEIIQFQSRLAGIGADFSRGLVTLEEWNTTQNRLTKTVLDKISSLEKAIVLKNEQNQTIRDWLHNRYQTRIDQKMAGRLPINLRLFDNLEGLAEDRAQPFREVAFADMGNEIYQAFQSARGRLLVVGIPGAGKTTQLLELALTLLEYESDALPAVLNLGTWTSDYKTLEEWLQKILPTELGANTPLAMKLLVENRVILLLDGFDEMRANQRLACFQAIGAYGSEQVRSEFIISSRKKEYLEVAAQRTPPVERVIEVGALSNQQIEAELVRLDQEDEKGSRAFLTAFRQNLLIQQVVQTPFYFNCLQLLFSRGKTLPDLHLHAENTKNLEVAILDRFIAEELHTCCNSEHAQHWLSFLASRMQTRRKVVFELRDLQYDWWAKWRFVELLLAWLFNGMLVGLVYGLVYSLLSGIALALAFGLDLGMLSGAVIGLIVGIGGLIVAGLIVGLIDGIRGEGPLLETKDSVSWSFEEFVSFYRKNEIVFLGAGLGFALVASLSIGLSIGSSDGLLAGSLTGLMSGLMALLIVGVIVGLTDILQNKYSTFLQINQPYQRFTASMRALHFSIFQHILLRWQLSHKNLLPLRLVDFLQEMAPLYLRKNKRIRRRFTTGQVHLLETDGASWRFRHRLVQEWFAERWRKEDAN